MANPRNLYVVEVVTSKDEERVVLVTPELAAAKNYADGVWSELEPLQSCSVYEVELDKETEEGLCNSYEAVYTLDEPPECVQKYEHPSVPGRAYVVDVMMDDCHSNAMVTLDKSTAIECTLSMGMCPYSNVIVHEMEFGNPARMSVFERKDVQVYYTHDNGARPFKVLVHPDAPTTMVRVYRCGDVPVRAYRCGDVPVTELDEEVGCYEAEEVYVGEPLDATGWGKGNSILLRLPAEDGRSRYVHIGTRVMSFCLAEGDEFVSFVSAIGNSDVVYPYVLGKVNLYLLGEDVYVPLSELPGEGDLYRRYYDYEGDDLELPEYDLVVDGRDQ